jgi:hypothetical protein
MSTIIHLPAPGVVALFSLAGLAAAWPGQLVFSRWAVVPALSLGLAAWAAFRPSPWPLRAALLGLWLWPASMALWIVVQIVLGGHTGLVPQLALGAGLGALIGWLVVRLGRTWRRLDRLRFGVVLILSLWAVLAVVLFWLLTGPRPDAGYPPREGSPYRLPYPAGKAFLCVQGNRAIVSHRPPRGEFAYDFAMPTGAPVCAARAGVVVAVLDTNDGNGLNAPNNYIGVDHGDDTFGWYHHIRKGGSLVKLHQRVERGQGVAECGNVGTSMVPHVHFEVTREDGVTIPVTFADVPGDGVPRIYTLYTSGNERR